MSPPNEYSGLISFRMDWLDLLAVPGTLKSLLQHHSSKASILQCSGFFTVQLSHPHMTTGKTIALIRWTFVGKVISLLFNMLSRHQGNANQSHNEISPHTCQVGYYQKQETSVGENVEKTEPSCTVDGKLNCCSHDEEQCGDSSKTQTFTHHIIHNPSPGYMFKGNEIRIVKISLHGHAHHSVVFTIITTWKQPECPQQVNRSGNATCRPLLHTQRWKENMKMVYFVRNQ